MYYIYKYVQDNEIVYIGKTNNIDRRAIEHSVEDNLKSAQLFYSYCSTAVEMDLLERALIDKYKPKYNIQFKESTFSSLIHVVEPSWLVYYEKCDNTFHSRVKNKKKYSDKIKLTWRGNNYKLSNIQLERFKLLMVEILLSMKVSAIDVKTLFAFMYVTLSDEVVCIEELPIIFNLVCENIKEVDNGTILFIEDSMIKMRKVGERKE